MSLIPEDIIYPQDTPYTQSALRQVVGYKPNPLAKKVWYSQENLELISSVESPVMTYAHPDLPVWMEFLKGLDSDWFIDQGNLQNVDFSAIIPRVKLGPKFPEWNIPQGTYWIDYEAVTASVSKLPEAQWIPTLKSRFPEGSFLLLGNIGKLASRLTLWKFRNQLWSHPLLQQVDAVVCPDFASYLDDPFPQGAAGERMTQIFVEAGYNAGKTMIPILSWQNRDALLRQADRLMSLYPYVHTVYIELLAKDVEKSPWLFSRFEDLEYIKDLPFRFLFSGLDAGWSIVEMKKMLPNNNFHLISIWPWLSTGMTPGTKTQKARTFRKAVHQLEDFHAGVNLPKPKPRPQDMTILKWQKENPEEN